MNNTKSKIKKFFIIVSYIIITIVIVLLFSPSFEFIKEPTKIFVVKEDILSEEEIVDALILREEQVITDDSGKLLHQEAFEGEKLSKNMKVFRYYSTNESKQIDRITGIDEEIQKYLIDEQDNINSSDNTIIDSSIETKLLELNSTNQQSKVLNFEKNINDEILEKAKISGELSKEGSKIKKLLDEKKHIEKSLTAESKIIYSPIAGIVSYRVDGFEEKFDKNKLNDINIKTLSEYDIKAGSIIPETKDKCKIINNFENFLVINSKSDHALAAEVGNNVKVRIGNEAENVATIEAINDAGKDGKIIILKLTVNTENLLQYRKIKIEILWWEDIGLKVNNKSIIKKGDLSYVVRKRGNIFEEILIKIVKETDDYSLITNYLPEELNEVKSNSIDFGKTKLNENDVILINPENENE